MTGRKGKITVICIAAVLVLALACSAAVSARKNREALYLFFSKIEGALEAREGILYGMSFVTEDGRIAQYLEAGTARFDKKLKSYIGEPMDVISSAPVYHFGDSDDMRFCISETERGYMLYQFDSFIQGEPGELSDELVQDPEGEVDTSVCTWGYLLDEVYGIESVEDIRCIIVSPRKTLLTDGYVGRYMRIGYQVLGGGEVEEIYGMLCDEPIEFSWYGDETEEPRFQFDFPNDFENELDPEDYALVSYGWRNITVILQNGDILSNAVYDANRGTFRFTSNGSSAELPYDAAAYVNGVLDIEKMEE